ncbi:NOL1/NOP2/sun family protein [Roseobacter sp. MED193]|uniref:RsmB/NOP family class I SAM-dependent RNA methyltransferase n=1 Tax=Roseobacter sp. MED193 TaxID=314262 RepID=UPI000068ACBC|nr:RsmB/NOP family class I SAM-dependent RNA methyltransferase [Roseobacter sp. MED193]EAQ45036.1 NOL1/NOP2/sun family protein [Roseobacter sp. MED193]
MTPAARQQAAIEILDLILDGEAAEKALTSWGRRNRYAGSKDRAAVRDHVFTALRCRRSFAVLGGAQTGRGLVLGSLRAEGVDPETVFSGQGYGPSPLTEAESAEPADFASDAERLDIPDWVWPSFSESIGLAAEAAGLALQERAPVHLRVNLLRSNRSDAIEALAEESILCEPHPASETALEVTQGGRKIRNSDCFADGLVELQDAASQAVVDKLPLEDGMRVLDFCAGGGGKSLAMAGRAKIDLFAYDANTSRMNDLPLRAQRAGADITCLSEDELENAAAFDLVLCDVPCSGSGSWRRAPEGKWRLTRAMLDEIRLSQGQILQDAAQLVREGGHLAYATCSMLDEENSAQIQGFLDRHDGWKVAEQASWQVQDGTDGFFVTVLTHIG